MSEGCLSNCNCIKTIATLEKQISDLKNEINDLEETCKKRHSQIWSLEDEVCRLAEFEEIFEICKDEILEELDPPNWQVIRLIHERRRERKDRRPYPAADVPWHQLNSEEQSTIVALVAPLLLEIREKIHMVYRGSFR